MRVAIREQLAALVILAVLVALAVVSVPTWIFVHNFVIGVESDGLSLTASLRASRITAEINLVWTLCQTVGTRVMLQQSYLDFYNGNSSDPLKTAFTDLDSAMSNSYLTGLLQARIYSRNETGASPGGLLNVTARGVGQHVHNIPLGYPDAQGRQANLSDTEYGYPPSLYPNITYQDLGHPDPYDNSTSAVSASAFPQVKLSNRPGLILGPMMINETFALMSLTIPVQSLYSPGFTLGYMTMVVPADSLLEVQSSREGLGKTGTMLLIGPENPSNRFIIPITRANSTTLPPSQTVADSSSRFVLPPLSVPGVPDRHASRDFEDKEYKKRFPLKQYPTVQDVFSKNITELNNATATLSTTNEQGVKVAVGVARPQTRMADWAVVVEKARSEAYEPISTLRKILLGCVFGTTGLLLILVLPCAHLSVRPIRRLKAATEDSIAPPGYEDDFNDSDNEVATPSTPKTRSTGSIEGFFANLRRKLEKKRKALTQSEIDNSRRTFKIPGRVAQRKHFITDELTELTQVYNNMTDELVEQYTLLDEKVAQRTHELEISKKAAEAANESKTLFIANISHELKTPLNGIMGICAICMEEDDVSYIKQSLKTLYRSGDLLLHLLEDLLSFSKNQICRQVSLEEKEFLLGDIRSQIVSIFDSQVREKKISFDVSFLPYIGPDSSPMIQQSGMEKKGLALGPPGMGQIKDAYLWGDQHRILQVIINLVSNSLKFTPVGGMVQLRIRCIGEVEQEEDDGAKLSLSRSASTRLNHPSRRRANSSSQQSASSMAGGTALAINPLDSRPVAKIRTRDRSSSPAATKKRRFMFEFEVEDTGRGIPKHMQEKIFEPFVQGDSGLSKQFGGTGLGLSICLQLARLMGGDIAITSTEGVGSTFTVQLPLDYVEDHEPSRSSSTRSRAARIAPATETHTHHATVNSVSNPSAPITDEKANGVTNGASAMSEANQARLVGLSAPFFVSNTVGSEEGRKREAGQGDGWQRLRVLVADDNSTNVEVVSRMLKLEKVYDVTVAKDGQEAFDLVKQNMGKEQQFDLIFMDVQMPRVDGLQSTRLIRQMGYLAPIIALTAFSEESNVKECMESGMNEFLSKPIRRPALKRVLTKVATIPEEPELVHNISADTTLENSPESEKDGEMR